MIWKGFGVLAGSAVVVVLMVVGLALLIVPDEPTFSEGLEEAAESDDGAVDFTPNAVGGQLEVTGATEGTITLERTADGPTYGLENSDMKIFFESDPLTISQMSYDGLAFFPEPEDCEFTEGEHNEETGLVGVEVSCPELVDIRDNGTVTLEGVLALPANMVITLDIPDIGGTISVGDEEWEVVDSRLLVGPTFQGSNGGSGEIGLPLNPEEPGKGIFLSYDLETDRLSPGNVSYDGTITDLAPDACDLVSETLMVVNPQAEYHELTITCENVDVPNLGVVSIEGSVVYEKLFFEEG
ncbi:MAG: hypothetical protein ACLFRT_08030 [Actinomycetota bacterium]